METPKTNLLNIDNDIEDLDLDNKYYSIIDQLKEVTEVLSKLDRKDVKIMMDGVFKDDKDKLLELYEKEVSILEKGDPVKLEILKLLNELGVQPVKLPIYNLNY